MYRRAPSCRAASLTYRVPDIKRGIQKTREGVPVLLEFITGKETEVSRPGT
ncbi:hypothetical protein [Bradyrhizobium sp.]|uniref:hypothetical protein n=1 Tax=Bradyrhizobium sp. TaxID=376 RepID=UPI0023878C0A|nr:hypothetical protein [Bradyrhizobium sp.]MDE2377667.1 hypothetical protein [Bradyrhizobium sp.]